MKLEAPAKINLTLEVTGVEANGYHTLDTLFAWLELHDTLELELAGESTLELEVEEGLCPELTAGQDNLVWRALRAMEAQCGRPLPTRFRLLKRIPSGGGLGGGSADAAAALVGLNRLHGLDLPWPTLEAIASRLGADVAFGLRGGFARGRHYGEQLEPLPLPDDLKARRLLLLAPGFPCPTPQVYRAWDEAPSRAAQGATDRFLSASAERRLEHLANDLQPAAESLFPALSAVRRSLEESGLEGVCLSGSGSTFFGFLPREGSPEELPKSLQGLGTVWVTQLREEQRSE